MRRMTLLLAVMVMPGAVVQAQTEHVSIPLPGDLRLHFTVTPFDSTQHRTQRDPEGIVSLIDGRSYFGSDGEIPELVITDAALEVGGKRIPLDVSAMFYPWFGKPSASDFTAARYRTGWLVQGLFSDGAGSYVAQWLVEGDHSIRTVLSDEESIIAHVLQED